MILDSLAFDEDYVRTVLPHLKPEYFSDDPERHVYQLIAQHFDKYGTLPSPSSLSIDLQAVDKINEVTFKKTQAIIDGLVKSDRDHKWMVDATEKFCKNRALYNALIEASKIMEDRTGKTMPDSIPDLLSNALAVGFDIRVGHDYVEDYAMRFDFYHAVEEKIPFSLEKFNFITKGGLSRKTLTVILAPTGVGKTLLMCSQAASNLMDGKNVLYITMEMAEERIAERIDANLLNTSIGELATLTREEYNRRVERVTSRTVGRLIIKEYPTASAHSGHFRALLKELRIKKNFVPDVIYIDYINICSSARVKPGTGVNSYTLVKSIAEELRGLAVENNVALVTATQTTRSGLSNSDIDMADTSESVGLPFTADLMYAVITNEELEKSGYLKIKQLKNRYDEIGKMRSFLIGVERSKMRIFDVNVPDPDTAAPPATGLQKPPEGPTDLFGKPAGLADSLKERLKTFK